MSQDTLMLYKLMVLYMLNKVDFPLTNSQVSEFILDKGYTNYFSLQQALHDLSDTELIRTEHIHNNSYYTINQAGEETLEFFGYKIPAEIKSKSISSLMNTNTICAARMKSPLTIMKRKRTVIWYGVKSMIRKNSSLASP